jgi:hypothetical protein
LSEVEAASGCVMVIYDKIFDLTTYAPDHPGGARYITDNCNIDATKEYADEHEEGLLRSVSGLQVGILKGGSDDTCGGGGTTTIVAPPAPSPTSGGGVGMTNSPVLSYMGDDDDDDDDEGKMHSGKKGSSSDSSDEDD